MVGTRPTDVPVAFDGLSEETLLASGSLKWSRYAPALGAFVAEMDFGTAPAVTRTLHEAVDRSRLGYLPPEDAAAMSAACAGWYSRRYGWDVPPAWITPLGDVVAGLEAAIEHFSAPGGAVVLPTPAYMPFLRIPGLVGRRLIQVPMVERAGRPAYDLDGIAAALAAGGGGLFVHVSPHNPTGRVFTDEEQLALAEVVEDAGARVFADEIHAPLTHPGSVHRPYAALSPETAGHTVTATSASKAWNVPGLKTAQFLLSNEADAQRWREPGERAAHGASILGVLAATAAYEAGEEWLDGVRRYLDGNRQALAGLLTAALPEVGYLPPEGTYLAWLDCRRLGLDGPAGPWFLDRAGVALVDGLECGAAGSGYVRLNFATPRPVLETMVDRMAAAVRRR